MMDPIRKILAKFQAEISIFRGDARSFYIFPPDRMFYYIFQAGMTLKSYETAINPRNNLGESEIKLNSNRFHL